MGSLLGIMTPAAVAAFIAGGRLLGFNNQTMHSLALGLLLMAISGLVGKLKLGRATALDFAQVIFMLLGWAGLWTSAPGAPRFALAHPETGLFACLLVSGLLPLLMGREPFATFGLRRRAPKQAWETPAFRSVARRLDMLWLAVFAAGLASSLAPWRFPVLDGAPGRLVFLAALPLALLLAGLVMSRRYPEHYLRRRGLPPWREATGSRPPQKPQEDPPMSTAAPQGPQDAATCRQLLEMMPQGFNPEEAKDLHAVIQFEVSGDEEFTLHLAIEKGQCVLVEGPAIQPDLTIQTPGQVWLAIAQGKLNGAAALMSGKFQAQGNLGLLMRMQQLFSRRG